MLFGTENSRCYLSGCRMNVLNFTRIISLMIVALEQLLVKM